MPRRENDAQANYFGRRAVAVKADACIFAVRRTARAAASARGGPLFAFAHCASPRSPRPEYRCLFVKQALRLRAVRRRPTAADCNSLYARLRPPPSANRTPAGRKNTSNNKKSMQIVVRFNYLYYFWGKRSVEMRRESRCCCVNIGNLQ